MTVQAWGVWLWEGQGEEEGVSLTWQEAKKMINITTHNAFQQHLHGTQVVPGNYSLIGWIILGYREAWPN